MGLMKAFLTRHFGSMANASEALNVSYRTVLYWTNGNPAGILRYLPHMVKHHDVIADEVVDVVMAEIDAMELDEQA
jgi:hypothetical protein